MRHTIDRGGFASPLPHRRRRRQRTALSLIATIALAISTMIAVTAVSLGIAQAGVLVAGQAGDGTLAVAFLICSILVGGIIAGFCRNQQERLR